MKLIINFFRNKYLFTFIIIVIFVLLFFRQCNTIKSLKQQIKNDQTYIQRIENNYNVIQDSIKFSKLKNGNLKAEISGYMLTVEELRNKYNDLFKKYEYEKNKPPKTIIESVIQIKEIIKEVPVYISIDSLGNKLFVFTDSVDYGDENVRILSGNIPFKVNYYSLPDSILLYPDSLKFYAEVFPGNGIFNLKQNISLITGLSIDNKTNKPMIWIQTKYPNLTFSKIKGAYIMDDPISKSVVRKLRKEFGISTQFGYGLLLTKTGYNTGLYIGIGISYTPRWLQFGK